MPRDHNEKPASECPNTAGDAFQDSDEDWQRQRGDGEQITSTTPGPGRGTVRKRREDRAAEFLRDALG